jgi:hypothetical protein
MGEVIMERAVRGLVWLGVIATLVGWVTSSPEATTDARALAFSFRVDPRVTGGLALADTWVSPPRYEAVTPDLPLVVEVRATAAREGGARRRVSARWTTADPRVATVTADEAAEMQVSVWGPGETTVLADAGDVASALRVSATLVNGAMRVTLTQ